MAYNVNIADADLKKSAVTYRKELLVMPVIAAEATLQHMTARPGVAGREVLGQLSGGIEIGPYDPERVDKTGVDIKPRTLETFLGSVVKKFDPKSAAKTVYGSLVTQGEALASGDLAMQVLYYLAMQLGQNLNKHIWDAKRNDAGDKTVDLFDGFDTITAKEITAGEITASKGNFLQLGSAIDDSNAVDILMNIYENAYDKDCRGSFGNVVYNQQYKKTYLEGTDNLCELVPLVSKKGSEYIHLTTKQNMVYGYGDGMDSEKIAIEKHHEFLLSFIATMFFGCQFETISKERLMVAKLATV